MTACTDDERRRVAASLRKIRSGWASGTCYYAIINVLGYPDTSREDGGHALYSLLADLIDPDCDEGRYSVARTVRPVDREALLELASTCDSVGDMYAAAHLETANDELNDLLRKIAELEWKTARTIRKAIGVDDG